MRSLDFAPLYRATVGFDRIADLMDRALSADVQPTYPPYNIEKLSDDAYRITMAVAGFAAANVMLLSVAVWAGHDGSMGEATRTLFHWLSAAIALLASIAALFAVEQDRSRRWRLTAALILGLAVVGMHHVAMAALTVTTIQTAVQAPPLGAPPLILAVGVAGVAPRHRHRADPPCGGLAHRIQHPLRTGGPSWEPCV